MVRYDTKSVKVVNLIMKNARFDCNRISSPLFGVSFIIFVRNTRPAPYLFFRCCSLPILGARTPISR
jgi:hypothetical protein